MCSGWREGRDLLGDAFSLGVVVPLHRDCVLWKLK